MSRKSSISSGWLFLERITHSLWSLVEAARASYRKVGGSLSENSIPHIVSFGTRHRPRGKVKNMEAKSGQAMKLLTQDLGNHTFGLCVRWASPRVSDDECGCERLGQAFPRTSRTWPLGEIRCSREGSIRSFSSLNYNGRPISGRDPKSRPSNLRLSPANCLVQKQSQAMCPRLRCAAPNALHDGRFGSDGRR